jgi:hypothetical protein
MLQLGGRLEQRQCSAARTSSKGSGRSRLWRMSINCHVFVLAHTRVFLYAYYTNQALGNSRMKLGINITPQDIENLRYVISANGHRVFVKTRIARNVYGKVPVSSKEDQLMFHVSDSKRLRKTFLEKKEYLEYHRDNVLKP